MKTAKVVYRKVPLRKLCANVEPQRTAVAVKENGNRRPNLIQALGLSTENVAAIEGELLRGGMNATVMLSEFIGKYFSDAKHNRLHSVPSFGDVLVILFSMTIRSSSSMEETVEQAALYCNLYPDAFNRLSEDLVAFFKAVNLEEPLAAIRKLAKEEDGEYEAMVRASGNLVDPF